VDGSNRLSDILQVAFAELAEEHGWRARNETAEGNRPVLVVRFSLGGHNRSQEQQESYKGKGSADMKPFDRAFNDRQGIMRSAYLRGIAAD
jgi:hypothetical protein